MTLGGAVRELGRNEAERRRPQTLAPGHDHSVPVEGVSHVRASVAQKNGGRRSEGDRGQRPRDLRQEPFQGGGDLRPGRGHDDLRGAHRLSTVETDRVAVAVTGERPHGGTGSDGRRVQPRNQRVHELTQPTPQRVEGRRRRSPGLPLRARGGEHPADQASILRFELPETREGGENRETLVVAGVNPGEQRLAETLHCLLTEAAPEEGRDRLVTVLRSGGTNEIEAHAQLPRPGEQAASDHGKDPGGHRQHHPLWKRVQRSTMEDVDGPHLGVSSG